MHVQYAILTLLQTDKKVPLTPAQRKAEQRKRAKAGIAPRIQRDRNTLTATKAHEMLNALTITSDLEVAIVEQNATEYYTHRSFRISLANLARLKNRATAEQNETDIINAILEAGFAATKEGK